jgi:hypothetical protein
VAKRWDAQSGYAGATQMSVESGHPARATTAQWFGAIKRYRALAVA